MVDDDGEAPLISVPPKGFIACEGNKPRIDDTCLPAGRFANGGTRIKRIGDLIRYVSP